LSLGCREGWIGAQDRLTPMTASEKMYSPDVLRPDVFLFDANMLLSFVDLPD
jgi:hypothetical protein